MINKSVKKSAVKKAVKKPAARKAPAKKAPAKKTATKKADEPTFKLLQTAKCKTVSGKSDLTYSIAADDEGDAMIRIVSNTGGGYWSKEFVQVSNIVKVLGAVPEDQSISSVHLFKLFTGKSQNSPGFLLAVLIKEGLLVEGLKKRSYLVDRDGVDEFLNKLDELKASKQND